MSFTFNNDLDGTTTSVQENGDAASTVTSSGTSVDFENCQMKEFLSAIEAKGIKSCGDIEVVSGDIYFAGGTSDKSIIKEIGLVFGTLSNAGVFSPVDPDLKGISRLGDGADAGEPPESDLETDTGVVGLEGDADQSGALPQTIEDSTVEELEPSARWYLRLVRPDGDIQYSDFQPLNDLMDAAAGSGNVRSMLDAMNELEELATLAGGILDANAYASQQDVDALEVKLDKDLITMSNALDAFETRLLAHIKAGDATLLTNLQNELASSASRYQAYYDGSKMTAEAALVSTTDCSSSSAQAVAGSMGIAIDDAADIANMLIDVRICDKSNGGEVLRNDIDVAWTAAYGSTGSEPTIDLSYVAVGCETFSNLYVQFVAVDCSAQSIPTPSPMLAHSDESYSPVFGADLTLNSPEAAADSDSGLQKLAFSATPAAPETPQTPMSPQTPQTPTSPQSPAYPLASMTNWSSDGGASIEVITFAFSGSEDPAAVLSQIQAANGAYIGQFSAQPSMSFGYFAGTGEWSVVNGALTLNHVKANYGGGDFDQTIGITPSDQVSIWDQASSGSMSP